MTSNRLSDSELRSLLESLCSALKGAMDPHREAVAHLGVNALGGTSTPYNDEAFQVWAKLYREDNQDNDNQDNDNQDNDNQDNDNQDNDNQDNDNQDIETLHHLAIMHHARAFDLEASDTPEAADEDWSRALTYWSLLCGSDLFWDRLAAKVNVGRRTDVIAPLRESWPEPLLQVHFDIALDPDTPTLRRGRYHVRLAMEAPFDARVKDVVRARSYESWIRDLDSGTWKEGVLDPELIRQGIERLAYYLDRDPWYGVATSDLLRLLWRQTVALTHRVNSTPCESEPWVALVDEICAAASKWEPFVAQLLNQQPPVDDGVRDKMMVWFRAMADAHQAIGRPAVAVRMLERARDAAIDDHHREQLGVRISEAMARQARNDASEESPNRRQLAEALCGQLQARARLSLAAYRYLAEALALLGQLDAAEQACRDGLNLVEPVEAETAPEIRESYQAALRELLEGLPEARRQQEANDKFKRAGEQFHAGHFEDAVASYREAIARTDIPEEYAPEFAELLANAAIGTANAFIETNEGDLDLAERWLREAIEWDAANDEHRERLDQFADFRVAANERREQFQRYGGQQAAELQQQGVRAFNGGDFEQAAEYFRQAISVSSDSRQLARELADALVIMASESARADTFNLPRVEALLGEARQLDPTNSQLAQVVRYVEQVKQQRQ